MIDAFKLVLKRRNGTWKVIGKSAGPLDSRHKATISQSNSSGVSCPDVWKDVAFSKIHTINWEDIKVGNPAFWKLTNNNAMAKTVHDDFFSTYPLRAFTIKTSHTENFSMQFTQDLNITHCFTGSQHNWFQHKLLVCKKSAPKLFDQMSK